MILRMERVHEYDEQLWAISIGLSKTFDRANWNKWLDALHAEMMPKYLINALRAIDPDQFGVVRSSKDNTSAPFPIQRGVTGVPL